MQNEKQEWVYCPVCGNKTRLRLREDTVLTHFPLFCPKCKKESLIDAKEYVVKEIKPIDKQDYSQRIGKIATRTKISGKIPVMLVMMLWRRTPLLHFYL